MKNSLNGRFERTLLAASIAAIGFAAPAAAWAEDADDEVRQLIRPDSQIEAGVGNVSSGGNSAKFRDYTGLPKEGGYFIGNVNVLKRGEDNANYVEIIGRDLGLDSRSLSIEGGRQGNFGLRLEHTELLKLNSDTYQSPFNGLGTSRLTKPGTWRIDTNPATAAPNPVANNTVVLTPMMVDLPANMKSFEIKTKRTATGIGLTKQITNDWDVAVNYKQEKKEGTKLVGAAMQTGTGGNRGTMLLPEPIDYTTDLFDAKARYTSEKLQVQLGYEGSLFQNDGQALTWDNLYRNSFAGALAGNAVGGNALTGRIGQMPSNQFHQLSASAAYALSKETRLTGTLSRGRMTQNEQFLPYSTAGVMPATTSLNGEIVTTHADLKVHSKLTKELTLNAGYKYDDRDNRTPVNRYLYYTADNTSVPAANSAVDRRNMPLSSTKQVVYADLDYRLSPATKLMAGYDFHHVKHTNEPTTGDQEQTVKAEVKHSFSDKLSGRLGYSYSDRRASSYNGAAPLSATYARAYLAGLCAAPNTFSYNGVVTACTGAVNPASATTPWLDTPALRKFFLADRKRDALRAFADYSPLENLDLQFSATYYNDKYPDTEAGFGLAKATGWTASFDANLTATEAVSGLFFASIEDSKTDQNAHNGGAGVTVLDRQLNNAAFDVKTGVISIGQRSATVGLGFRVKPGGRYEWGGNLTHVNGLGKTNFSHLGSAVGTVLPMPDTVSRRNRLDLFGQYQLEKNLSLNLKYVYEKFHSNDWAWDGQTLTSSTTFIGTNQTSPDYQLHFIGASIAYRFQ